MWNVSPDKVQKMFLHMADRHKGEMHSIYLDWQVYQISHPRYDEKIEQLVPLVVIDFK